MGNELQRPLLDGHMRSSGEGCVTLLTVFKELLNAAAVLQSHRRDVFGYCRLRGVCVWWHSLRTWWLQCEAHARLLRHVGSHGIGVNQLIDLLLEQRFTKDVKHVDLVADPREPNTP